MRVRNAVQSVSVVTAAIIACLLCLEVAIRVYSAWLSPRMMVLDDRLGWKHAGHVRKAFANEDGDKFIVDQNRYGHRGREYNLQRTTGKYRVLILGDSFTEGVQVSQEDLFSARLERMNQQIEVLNAGVGGYGTVQEYLYYVSEGVRFRPNLLLLMFVPNDLSDNCLSYYAGFGPRPYALVRDGEVEIVERLEPREFLRFTIPVPFRAVLSRHSYLYYFLNTHVYQKLFARRMRELEREDLRRTTNCGRYQIFYWLVSRMNEMMKADGGDFAVVLIPTDEDVRRGYSAAEEPILKFCNEAALKCLQLLSRFVGERRSGTRLYFDVDIHLTRLGHAIAAEEISSFLSHIMASAKMYSRHGGRREYSRPAPRKLVHTE